MCNQTKWWWNRETETKARKMQEMSSISDWVTKSWIETKWFQWIWMNGLLFALEKNQLGFTLIFNINQSSTIQCLSDSHFESSLIIDDNILINYTSFSQWSTLIWSELYLFLTNFSDSKQFPYKNVSLKPFIGLFFGKMFTVLLLQLQVLLINV